MGFMDDWQAKRNGKIDGSQNIPNKTQTEHAHYEQQLALIANKEIRGIANEWENTDKKLKGQYCASLRKYIDACERNEKETGEAEAVRTGFAAARKTLDGSSDNPPMAKWLYWLIIAAIAIGEIPLTTQVFEIFGSNIILTFASALVLCIMVPLASHLVGMIIKEKFNKTHVTILVAILTVLISTLVAISWLREEFFKAEGQSLLGVQMDPSMVTFVFLSMQFLLFTTAAAASFFSHDAHPGRGPAIRDVKRISGDFVKEQGEADEAKQIRDSAAENLAKAEMERENTFHSYQNRAEAVVNHSKSLIAAYRGANVRARGDAEVASFKSYPDISIPGSLQELNKECGFSVPEAAPVLCPVCGASNPFSAPRCHKCGNNIK